MFDHSVVALVPELRGTWDSNLGLVFDLSQLPSQGGNFTWTARQRSIPGRGTIEGLQIRELNWTDVGQPFEATGTIEVGPAGYGRRISLSNGAILVRALVPNLSGVWHSKIGLTFDMSQQDVSVGFNWTVRERPMPGNGEAIGSWLHVSWVDVGQPFEASGIVERDADNRATRITLSNGVTLTR